MAVLVPSSRLPPKKEEEYEDSKNVFTNRNRHEIQNDFLR
jgi:hypothetical protein